MHIGDGLLYGDPNDHRFQKVDDQKNLQYNIKVWENPIHEEDEKYLGVVEGNGRRHLHPHVRVVSIPLALRSSETQEPAMYRSTLAKARWPVNTVVPEMAYRCERACGEINVQNEPEWVKLIRRTQEIKSSGARWRVCLMGRDSVRCSELRVVELGHQMEQ